MGKLHHLGFYGSDGQPASANQAAVGAALTDSTTGTAGTTLAAGVGIMVVSFQFDLADIADGELVTDYTLGFKFKILSTAFAVTEAVTTASKATTFAVDIGATETTGGLVAVTSAAATPVGTVIAGSAITAGNTGSSSDTISIRAESTTAHVEGKGSLLIRVQNMDVADAFASLADRANDIRTLLNQLRSDLVDLGLIKGSA